MDSLRHSSRRMGRDRTNRPKRNLLGVNIFRFENGKVTEIWNHRDDLGLMEQVGAAIYAGARDDH